MASPSPFTARFGHPEAAADAIAYLRLLGIPRAEAASIEDSGDGGHLVRAQVEATDVRVASDAIVFYGGVVVTVGTSRGGSVGDQAVAAAR